MLSKSFYTVQDRVERQAHRRAKNLLSKLIPANYILMRLKTTNAHGLAVSERISLRGIAQDDVNFKPRHVKCLVSRQHIAVMWRDRDEGLSALCANDLHLKRFTDQLFLTPRGQLVA